MNHRQWKKKFKKVHGRNPFFFEDKKNKAHNLYLAFRNLSPSLTKAIGDISRGFKEALYQLGESISELGKRIRDITW